MSMQLYWVFCTQYSCSIKVFYTHNFHVVFSYPCVHEKRVAETLQFQMCALVLLESSKTSFSKTLNYRLHFHTCSLSFLVRLVSFVYGHLHVKNKMRKQL